jgi:hypothetical protein
MEHERSQLKGVDSKKKKGFSSCYLIDGMIILSTSPGKPLDVFTFQFDLAFQIL